MGSFEKIASDSIAATYKFLRLFVYCFKSWRTEPKCPLRGFTIVISTYPLSNLFVRADCDRRRNFSFRHCDRDEFYCRIGEHKLE